ncbi:putative disease resistance protein RGA3 [Spatholobus suberectus]|nr:putative disease resistance protein RGA3 [Spatholobus suberectus]
MESEKDFKLVGREKEKEEIIDQLILLRRGGNEANPPVPVIIIAGLAGVGKTKLASQVFKDENVKQNVGLPARVSGTNCNSFDAVSIARRVIGATASSPNRIVFLDDWRVEIGDQDVNALQHELKEAAGLCVTAIVITTRSCLVAMARKIAASPVKSYTLPGLNEEESLTLFQTILGRGPVDNSSITEDVRRKFVGQCGGVPRAIIIMAELLCSPGSRLTELTGQFLNKLKNYYDVEFPDNYASIIVPCFLKITCLMLRD